jgi:hypothetical protein
MSLRLNEDEDGRLSARPFSLGDSETGGGVYSSASPASQLIGR